MALDHELGRETSSQVKRLVGMTLPPLVRSNKPLTEATGQRTFQLAPKEQLLQSCTQRAGGGEMFAASDDVNRTAREQTIRRIGSLNWRTRCSRLPMLVSGRVREPGQRLCGDASSTPVAPILVTYE